MSLHFSFNQKGSDGEGEVAGSRSGGFLIAIITAIVVLSLIFIFPLFDSWLNRRIQNVSRASYCADC